MQSFTATANIDLSPAVQTCFVGDTIRINKEVLYSFIRSSTKNIDPRKDFVQFRFQLVELMSPSNNLNARFAGNKFTHVSQTGSIDSSYSTYYLTLANDSLHNRFVGNVGLVPNSAGIFALVAQKTNVLYGNCNEGYSLAVTERWNTPSNNSGLASGFAINNSIYYSSSPSNGVYILPLSGQEVFFFRVQ